jgi:allophanate hydrolase subunit 2
VKPVLEIVRPAVATTIQDRGRYGHRSAGLARSGAMDQGSLDASNQLAGAPQGSAAVEFGPGPAEIRILQRTTIAFAGAKRAGAPWWETIEAKEGQTFSLENPSDGNWSYLAVEGGVDSPLVAGSRSTNLREGIGSLLQRGAFIVSQDEPIQPQTVNPLLMQGPVRVFGELPGRWKVSTRIDRMGYQLEGSISEPLAQDAWSEPVLPGCIQIYPAGLPVVLMVEGSTVGGYKVGAVVHSHDLRLVAQARSGKRLDFTHASEETTFR